MQDKICHPACAICPSQLIAVYKFWKGAKKTNTDFTSGWLHTGSTEPGHCSSYKEPKQYSFYPSAPRHSTFFKQRISKVMVNSELKWHQWLKFSLKMLLIASKESFQFHCSFSNVTRALKASYPELFLKTVVLFYC